MLQKLLKDPRDRGAKDSSEKQTNIEDPSSKLEGIFDRKERCHLQSRSLTPQQATGNALAIAVQRKEPSFYRQEIWASLKKVNWVH